MSFLKYENDILKFEDISIREIAEGRATPFYCYSKQTLTNNFREFSDSLTSLDATVCFSLKSNSNLTILKTLTKLEAGGDVVSEWEMRKALQAGMKPNKIVFSGIGKTASDIQFAISNNCLQINAESLDELDHINRIASVSGKIQKVGIRINPDIQSETHKKISTGSLEDKFGISIEQTYEIFQNRQNYPNLEISSIAFHIGSNIKDLTPFQRTFEIIGELVAKINSETKKINTVDVGGGISPEKRNFTFEDYKNLIVKYFDTENLKFIFEPGRLIAANAGILVSKVLYTKNITGKKFVIIDAGMNDMMRPALYDAHHEIMPDIRTSEYDEINTDIVGPICESSDVFLNIQKFNKVKSGQYVILKDVGAYGSTMSSNYNARPLIEELMVDGSQIRIIRKTQSYEDFIKNEI